MAINRAQLVKELVPGLHALFGLEYERYNNEHEDIFDTENSERAFEEEVMLSGFGPGEIVSFVHLRPLRCQIQPTKLAHQ